MARLIARAQIGVHTRTALAAALVLAGCADGDGGSSSSGSEARSHGSSNSTGAGSPALDRLPVPVQEIEIDGTEYAFQIRPDPSAGLRPGWTLLHFHNIGGEAHQAMFARIKDGVDMSELAAAGAGDSSGASAIEFVDMIGGVSYIGSGQDTTAMVKLDTGLVMAMCYVPTAEGVAHGLLGMTSALNIIATPTGSTGATARAPTEPNATASHVVGTIEFGPDGYRIPDTMHGGWHRVVNSDTALHEMAILRLERAVDDDEAANLVADLAANRQPKIAVEAVGGMGAVSSGFEGYLDMNLDPGEYMVVDFMPDPGNPRPHMLDGYFATFSV